MSDAIITLGLDSKEFNSNLDSAINRLAKFNQDNNVTNSKLFSVQRAMSAARKEFMSATFQLKQLGEEGRKTDKGLMFQKMQENAKNTIKQLKEVQEELRKVENEANNANIKGPSVSGGGMKGLGKNLVGAVQVGGSMLSGDIASSLGSVGSTIGMAVGGPIGAAVGQALGEAGGKLIEFGGECVAARAKMEDLQVSFKTLLGNATDADAIFSEISEYGSKTPYQTDDLAEAAKLMLSFGISTDKVVPSLKQMGDIAMGDNNKLQSLALAFSQMSSSGRVMKEDLNQMINAGFNPLQVISEKTGESMASLQDKVSKGQISVKQIQQAFADATGEGGKFHNMAANMSDTINGKISTLSDNWEQMKANMGGLMDSTVKNALQMAINMVQDLNKAVSALRMATGDYNVGNDDYSKKTIAAVGYANKKGNLKDRNKSINRAIYFEKQRQKRLEAQLKKQNDIIKAWNDANPYKDANGKNQIPSGQRRIPQGKKTPNTNVVYAAYHTRPILERDLKLTKGRISYYQDALRKDPYKEETPTTPTPTKTSGGGRGTTRGTRNTAKGEVIPSGSLAELEKQAEDAKKRIRLAVGEEAYLEAEKAWVEAEKKVEEYKYNAYKNAPNSPTKDIKLPQTTPTNVLYGDDVTPKFDLPSQKDLNNLKLPKIEDSDDYQQGLENIQNMFQFLEYNSGTVGDFANQWADLANAFKVGGANAQTAGAGLAVLGQQLQQIGGNGAIAKMGAVMAAIGQCILGFATASAQAASLGPFGWLAFVGAGLGTLATMVATIQGFSNGGIVGGATTSGDMQLARVNAGEMILNNSQQARLFDVLDGGTSIARNNGQVEFKISGQALVGTLKNYNNKMMKVR